MPKTCEIRYFSFVQSFLLLPCYITDVCLIISIFPSLIPCITPSNLCNHRPELRPEYPRTLCTHCIDSLMDKQGMNATNAPIDGESVRSTYAPILAPEITMPATAAAAAVLKQPSARKLAKEKLLSSISNMYSPNAKVCRCSAAFLINYYYPVDMFTCLFFHILIPSHFLTHHIVFLNL